MRGGTCSCRYCTERVQIKCAFCRKTAWVLRRKVEERGQRFCSRRCANFWNSRKRAGRPPCECGCGLLIGPQATRFISGHNPRAPRAPLRGPANPRWSGGPKRPHLSPEHRTWREAVFRKDDYTCQNCGARSSAGNPVYLQAHHVKRVVDEPFAAFDVDNGQTLCLECHRTFHWGADRKRRRKRVVPAAE
jgi:5-methylcytosine-specific restriction endonuclease McrA